jgi:hypothetical protein
MTGKFLLAVIAVCVMGGVIGGLVVVFVRDDSSVIQVQDSGPGNSALPPTIIIQSAPPPEKPRAKSHYIKPGQVDRI